MENNDNYELKQENQQEPRLENSNTCNDKQVKSQKNALKKRRFPLIIGITLSLIILVGGIFGVVTMLSGDQDNNLNKSENDDDKMTECSHKFTLIESEATCTGAGYDTFKCSKCDKTKKEYKNELGHTTTEGTCSRCGESFGPWRIDFYVDEFNLPTDDAYIRNDPLFAGTFSNSATTNSNMYALIIMDSDGIAIKLWEYSTHEVKASSLTQYTITVLDDTGTKHYLSGKMNKGGERIFLSDWTLAKLLNRNNELKIYIKENTSYGVASTYLFTVKNCNFTSVYEDFNN